MTLGQRIRFWYWSIAAHVCDRLPFNARIYWCRLHPASLIDPFYDDITEATWQKAGWRRNG